MSRLATAAPLTFAGEGVREAEAQLTLAAVMVERLRRDLSEGFDGSGDLQDRVSDVLEVLVAAIAAIEGGPS